MLRLPAPLLLVLQPLRLVPERTVPLSVCNLVALPLVVNMWATLQVVALLVGPEVRGLGQVGRLLGVVLQEGAAGKVRDRSEGRTEVGR